MATKDKKEQMKKMNSGGRSSSGGGIRGGSILGILKKLRNVIGTIIAIFGVLFLLSGGINQVRTGETLAQYAMDIGKSIGDVLKKLPNGNGPVKVNENGIYFNNADVPEESAIDGNKLPVPSSDDINNTTQKISDATTDIVNGGSNE